MTTMVFIMISIFFIGVSSKSILNCAGNTNCQDCINAMMNDVQICDWCQDELGRCFFSGDDAENCKQIIPSTNYCPMSISFIGPTIGGILGGCCCLCCVMALIIGICKSSRKANRTILVPEDIRTSEIHPPPLSKTVQTVYQQPGQPQVYPQPGQQVYQQQYLYGDPNIPIGEGNQAAYVPPSEGFDINPYAQAMYGMVPPPQVYQGQYQPENIGPQGYQGQQPGYPQSQQTNQGPQMYNTMVPPPQFYQGQQQGYPQSQQTNQVPQMYNGMVPPPQVYQGQYQPENPVPQVYQGQQPGYPQPHPV